MWDTGWFGGGDRGEIKGAAWEWSQIELRDTHAVPNVRAREKKSTENEFCVRIYWSFIPTSNGPMLIFLPTQNKH